MTFAECVGRLVLFPISLGELLLRGVGNERSETDTSQESSTHLDLEQAERDGALQAEEKAKQLAALKRGELRLEAELELEFMLDKDRREKLIAMLGIYADESLPVEIYEQRLQAIRNAVQRHTPSRAKQYQSMQEIIDEFDRQLADVAESTQSEFEKESLRSLVLMERQNAIQRFIQS